MRRNFRFNKFKIIEEKTQVDEVEEDIELDRAFLFEEV